MMRQTMSSFEKFVLSTTHPRWKSDSPWAVLATEDTVPIVTKTVKLRKARTTLGQVHREILKPTKKYAH